MCGIAGVLDLKGRREVPEGVARRMAQAIFHRGPDEEGYFERPGVAMASRRLSIDERALRRFVNGERPISARLMADTAEALRALIAEATAAERYIAEALCADARPTHD